MFAHPATSHFARQTHGHMTTSKKNLNKENSNALPSKTPSRAGGVGGKFLLGPATHARIGLAPKTVGRDGNLGGGRMDDAKGKGKEVDEIEPKRLFASTSNPANAKSLPPSKSMGSFPTIPASTRKAFGSKTPAPNRVQNTLRTPAPSRTANTLRTPAPSRANAAPEPTPLPSATKPRRRSRQSFTPGPNNSLSGSHSVRAGLSDSPAGAQRVEFNTPQPKWDEEVSLGSITEGLEGLDIGTALDELVEVDEGDDELEYMPPPLKELPWEPEFPMLDLGAIFTSMSQLPPLWVPFDAAPLTMPELIPDLGDTSDSLILCDSDELEDEMFRRRSNAIKLPPPPKVSAVESRSTGSVTSRSMISSGRKPLEKGILGKATNVVALRPKAAIQPSSAFVKPPVRADRPGVPATAIARGKPVVKAPTETTAKPVMILPDLEVKFGQDEEFSIALED